MGEEQQKPTVVYERHGGEFYLGERVVRTGPEGVVVEQGQEDAMGVFAWWPCQDESNCASILTAAVLALASHVHLYPVTPGGAAMPPTNPIPTPKSPSCPHVACPGPDQNVKGAGIGMQPKGAPEPEAKNLYKEWFEEMCGVLARFDKGAAFAAPELQAERLERLLNNLRRV